MISKPQTFSLLSLSPHFEKDKSKEVYGGLEDRILCT